MKTIYKDAPDEDLLASLGGDVKAPEPKQEAEYEPTVSPSGHTGTTSNVENKALSLLGSGIQAEQVASALGVSPSRIAQLLAQKTFADKVAALRYKALQSHNKRDTEYDNLEDKLMQKLNSSLPMLIKPGDILNAIKIVNGAKRRGQSGPSQVTNQQVVVNISLPNVVAQKFTTDMNNQVVRAGSQELLTMPSGNLLKRVEEKEALRLEDKED